MIVFRWLSMLLIGCVVIMLLPILLALLILALPFFAIADWRKRRRFRFRGGLPQEHQRALRGKGKSLEQLAAWLDCDQHELERFHPRYRSAMIPKRRGGKRRLEIPDEETKRLQRLILRRLLKNLHCHDACHAYEQGRSTVSHASLHVDQAVVIKADITGFFESTTAERVDYYFRRIGWDADAAACLTRLVTHDGHLPQGAPTSPRLSNLVNQHLDNVITRMVTRYRGTYTRYSDDMVFSFPKDYPRKVRGIIQKLRIYLRKNGYQLNDRKLLILRQHQQQRVTGLVVNQRVNIPRKQRRLLRAVVHRMQTGGKPTMTPEQLHGWMAYLGMVEQASPKPGTATR